MSDIATARNEAIRLLCQAQAADRLSVEAFEARLEQLKHAPNAATLAAIVADLQDSNQFEAVSLTTKFPVAVRDHTDVAPVQPADYLRISSVFASTRRAGSWTVPLELEAKVLFGEMTLDLKDAVFGSDVVDINVDVALGSFSLIVPAGTQVENEVAETMASSTHSTRSARGARPNGLLVRVRGRAFMASIDVKERFPSDGRKQSLMDKLLGSGD